MSKNKKYALIPALLLAALLLAAATVFTVLPFDLSASVPSNSFGNAMNGACAAVDGSLTYYVDSKGVLYYEGNNDKNRISANASCVYPYKSGVIYISGGDAYYSPFTGGSDAKRLLIKDVESLMVSGNWIYFTRADGILKKVHYGSDDEKDLGLTVRQYAVSGSYVTFIGEDGQVYSAKTDGSNVNPYLAEKVDRFMMYDNYFYYVSGGVLSSCDAGNPAAKHSYFEVDEFNIMDSYILVYTDKDGMHTLDMTSDSAKPVDVKTKGEGIKNIAILDDLIYYRNSDGTAYIMQKDGSESSKK